MAASIVSLDKDTIVSSIDIAAPPELVFKGICDAETVRRRVPALTVFEMDLRVGGKWRLELPMPKLHHGVSLVRHDGEVLEIDPPRLLVYTWFANFHNDPRHRSIVRWELSPTRSGTHVQVTHSGLGAEPQAANDYAKGWPGVLEELKTFLAKSQGERR
jgi:uncharacterized protein YndB with AHSA1/START domain